VSLTLSGLPNGVTAAWSGNPVTLSAEAGKSTLTLTASALATVGSTTITVTATGGGVTASKQITVQVTQAPGLQVALGASSLTIGHASGGAITVAVSPVGAFSAAVTLTVSGLPSGVTPTLSKTSLAAPGNGVAILTLLGSSAAKVGTTAVTITATGVISGISYTASQVLTLILK